MDFKTLELNENLLKAVEALGFKEATKVQSLSIPPVLAGKDVIVMAKTGSGKTGAFSLPIIQQLENKKGVEALIVTPTRELAVQVDKDIKTFNKFNGIKSTCVYGGHSLATEISQLKAQPKIVTGTPGRIIQHLHERNLNGRDIKYLVLDEADRMLDMGFIDQMYEIMKHLSKERQTLLFSATMPTEIQNICKKYMNEPETIAIDSDTKTVDSIKQYYFRIEKDEKRDMLDRVLAAYHPKSCMIFCNMRVEVDKIQNYLERKGYVSQAIHGANTQHKRMKTIEAFKTGKIQILVATDVAARGIHIDDMAMVINYDVPVDKDNYIHRIGRTGRAGNGGQAVTMVTSDDLYAFYEVEEHAGARVDEITEITDEAVETGRKIIDDIWASKRAEIKKRTEARKKKHEQVRKQPVKKKSHPKANQPHLKANKPHSKAHKKYDERKPKKDYKKPIVKDEKVVRRVIEENFVPIQHKPEPVVKKKKFSIKALFKKR